MSSVIDNKKRSMLSVLKDNLREAESIDIATAFFYFSGFDLIAEELKDKKIRILVGMELDPTASSVAQLCREIKTNRGNSDAPLSLSKYAMRGYSALNNSLKKQYYIDGFVKLVNESPLATEFDCSSKKSALDIFLEKIRDGSLEIKLNSNEDDHSKYYVIKYKEKVDLLEDGSSSRGTVIVGSSNFTYNGLCGQNEINEDIGSYNDEKFDEYSAMFESDWNSPNAINICVNANNDNTKFVDEIKQRLSVYSLPKPFEIFLRILSEMYSATLKDDIRTPANITHGRYADYKYQLDAIKYGISCIKRNNGVIIADVVGLGKSIIAAAIANNLDYENTIIIAPPHLVDQWGEYARDFGLRAYRVVSSGKIDQLYESLKSKEQKNETLFIIDEAHRYRNEESISYQYLHQITRMNPSNKVMLLTATPYNNRPQDIFALIKLFQTPSKSTINTVDNLDTEFHRIISEYNLFSKTAKDKDTDTKSKDEARNKLAELGEQLRILVDPVVVRRSRIDLKEIVVYQEDLKAQDIDFPTVVGPELIEYDLGDIRDIYIETLEMMSSDQQLTCARYKQAKYLVNIDEFMKEYGDLFAEKDIVVSQKNLAQFIKNLLVMRFESSKVAFKNTLTHIINSYKTMIKWWDKGFVPISLRGGGKIDNPEDILAESEDEIDEYLDETDNLNNIENETKATKEKYHCFEKKLFTKEYIKDVNQDLILLQKIYNMWFSSDDDLGIDPKYTRIARKIKELLDYDPDRKIVVFSTYADTAKYVQKRLTNDGYKALLYTAKSTDVERQKVRKNFDASYDEGKPRNDYDILVATDSLSEGFNLNRAGVVINYDIPYNPTRVIQRIGRINRINKKVFKCIYIFNCFPTDVGEENISLKTISTLKMLLIQNVVGSDTRTLTPDEDLTSYFKRQYNEASEEEDEQSWDITYRNIYEKYKNNTSIMDSANEIPVRAKIVRKDRPEELAISYINKGDRQLFVAIDSKSKPVVIAPERALKYFEAGEGEEPYEFDGKYDGDIKMFNDFLDRHPTKNKNTKTMNAALNNIEGMLVACPGENNYLQDLKEVMSDFDDLSDGEIREISRLKCSNKIECIQSVATLKELIPIDYINSIKIRAAQIDSEYEKIIFIEELEK